MAKEARKPVRKHSFANAPVINAMQLGGIETSVLDNGPGRGVRIAWVNTGGGLRYKVVIDRGLDIADAEFMNESLTWHSLAGTVAPSFSYTRGMDWIRGFCGGMMASCGPLNTGAPFTDENAPYGEDYGLHGTHSYTRATVESIVNPDLARGQYEMSITAIVRTARLFNPNVELRRTISSTLGEPAIRIHDEFVNRGNEPVVHTWLMHVNFGYPLLAPGESIYCYRGKLMPIRGGEKWFKKGNDYRSAPVPRADHRGWGEYFTYIDPPADRNGMVLAGVVNKKRGYGVKVEYAKKDFPRMGNWQHWGPAGEYVGALEPMTGSVEGREVDRQRGWLKTLKPGQKASYRCTLAAINKKNDLEKLLRLNR